jgi:hypothetical protein
MHILIISKYACGCACAYPIHNNRSIPLSCMYARTYVCTETNQNRWCIAHVNTVDNKVQVHRIKTLEFSRDFRQVNSPRVTYILGCENRMRSAVALTCMQNQPVPVTRSLESGAWGKIIFKI